MPGRAFRRGHTWPAAPGLSPRRRGPCSRQRGMGPDATAPANTTASGFFSSSGATASVGSGVGGAAVGCVVGGTAVGGGWTGGEVAGAVGRSEATGSLAGGAVGVSVATGVRVGGANVAAGGASVTGSLQATETASRARIDNIFRTVLITLFPEPPKTGKPPNFQKLSIPLPANARTKYRNYTLRTSSNL